MSVSIIIEGIQGQLKGKKWVFNDSQVIKIGRYTDSDIVIPADERNISRQQCEIRVNNGKVIIVDKDGTAASPAGTWIDNRKIPSGEGGYSLDTQHLLGLGIAGNTELFKLLIEKEEEEEPVVIPGETVGVDIEVPEPDPIPEPKTVPDLEPDPEPDPEPNLEPDPDSDSEPDPEPDSEPDPDSALDSEPDPDLDSEDKKARFEELKSQMTTLGDAYRLLEFLDEDETSELNCLFRLVMQKHRFLEAWEEISKASKLDDAYRKLSQALSQDENNNQQIDSGKDGLFSDGEQSVDGKIAGSEEDKKQHKIESEELESILIDLDDYDIIDIKPNLVYDDKIVKDEEEKAIDHQVKLAPIKVGGIKGDYKMIGSQSKGGFGLVVRVQHKKSKKIYAMKEILSSGKDPQRIKWFKREVMVGQQLDHPNVVKVFEGDFDEKARNYRYLMEYCPGGDLQSYMDALLDKGKAMKLEDAVQIMYQLLDGLDYLHNVEVVCFDGNGKAKKIKGLVHRDIKPKNIFLMKKGDISHIKIGDFGTLKSVQLAGDSCHTKDGAVVFSDGFAPAKQFNKKENGFRYAKPPVDVFAAAAVFYFLLTGKKIKRRKNLDGEIEIVPIRELNKNIPVELADVIDNVLLEDDIIEDDMVTSAKQFKNNIIEVMKYV